MRNKVYWGIATLIILLVGVSAFLLLRDTDTNQEPAEEIVPKPPPPGETFETGHWDGGKWHRTGPIGEKASQKGHSHDQGTMQTDRHNPFDTSTWIAPTVNIPKNVKDPAVAAAWKRLDDISKNRHKWGDFSPRALELMDELTPVPSIYDTAEHGDCGEGVIELLDELASFRDPRSTELLLNYQIDSGIWGRPIDEALAEMGPASIPALIAGLNPERAGEVMLHVPIDLLPQIVEAYRSELGGIVEHIIIPKLKVIAAPENPEDYALSNKLSANEALVRLQKPKGQ